jgi:hypothetical protein
MTRALKIASILALASLFAGCSRGISEGVYAFTGSSGKSTLIQGDPAKVALLTQQYGTVKVEPFSNDVGNRCPDQFLNELPLAIQKELLYRDPSVKESLSGKKAEELGPFFTGPAEKVLVIKGKVIQYDIGGVVDKVSGPLDEAICRVQLVDEASGELLAEANLTGRVKSSVRTGPAELAKGVGKAIKKGLKPKKD